jgi:hypothetical protein
MRLRDLPWRAYDVPASNDTDTREIAEVRAADNRTITVWRPGSRRSEIEIKVQGGPHEFLSALEARSRLLALGAWNRRHPLPNNPTTSRENKPPPPA